MPMVNESDGTSHVVDETTRDLTDRIKGSMKIHASCILVGRHLICISIFCRIPLLIAGIFVDAVPTSGFKNAEKEGERERIYDL